MYLLLIKALFSSDYFPTLNENWFYYTFFKWNSWYINSEINSLENFDLRICYELSVTEFIICQKTFFFVIVVSYVIIIIRQHDKFL